MIGHLLNRTVDVLRETRVPDGSGGWQTSDVLVLAGVRCRIPQATDAERVLALQAGAEHDARVYVPAGTDIRRGDTLRADTGESYRVLAVVFGSAAGVYTRADAQRVQRQGVSP